MAIILHLPPRHPADAHASKSRAQRWDRKPLRWLILAALRDLAHLDPPLAGGDRSAQVRQCIVNIGLLQRTLEVLTKSCADTPQNAHRAAAIRRAIECERAVWREADRLSLDGYGEPCLEAGDE